MLQHTVWCSSTIANTTFLGIVLPPNARWAALCFLWPPRIHISWLFWHSSFFPCFNQMQSLLTKIFHHTFLDHLVSNHIFISKEHSKFLPSYHHDTKSIVFTLLNNVFWCLHFGSFFCQFWLQLVDVDLCWFANNFDHWFDHELCINVFPYFYFWCWLAL